jgi:hypothetical protein
VGSKQDDQGISFTLVPLDSAASLVLFQRPPIIRADGALELWITPYQVSEFCFCWRFVSLFLMLSWLNSDISVRSQYGELNFSSTLFDDGGVALGSGGSNTSVTENFTIRILPVNNPPFFELSTEVIQILEGSSTETYKWLLVANSSISKGPPIPTLQNGNATISQFSLLFSCAEDDCIIPQLDDPQEQLHLQALIGEVLDISMHFVVISLKDFLLTDDVEVIRLNNRRHRLGRHLSSAIESASVSDSESEGSMVSDSESDGSMSSSGIESAGGSSSVYAEPTACTTDGYTGPNCQACDKDTYSGNCQHKCNAKLTCSKNGRCSGLDGRCICNEGFSGPSCSITTELTSAPSDTLPVIKMRIGLPLSKAEFTPAVQALVREAIAAAVGVDASRVRILSVVEAVRRRLLADSLALEIAIEMPPGESRLDTMTANSTMTANNLNRELAARNLPQATMLEPPIIVSWPKPTALNVELWSWPETTSAAQVMQLQTTLRERYRSAHIDIIMETHSIPPHQLSDELVSNEEDQKISFSVSLIPSANVPENNGPIIFETPLMLSNGTLMFTVSAYRNGNSSFRVILRDDGGNERGGSDTSVSLSFMIEVLPVNDAPSFEIPRQFLETLELGPGESSVMDKVVTNISRGPPLGLGVSNEDYQEVTFVVSEAFPFLSTTGVITSTWDVLIGQKAPEIAPNGTLILWLSPYMNGTTIFNISLKDAGGTELGGKDSSRDWKLLTIKVLPVNQAPTFELRLSVIHIVEAPRTRETQLALAPKCRPLSQNDADPLPAANLYNISRADVATHIKAGPPSPEEDTQSVHFTIVPLQCRIPAGAVADFNNSDPSPWALHCPGLYGDGANSLRLDAQLFQSGTVIKMDPNGTLNLMLEPERFGTASFVIKLEDNGEGCLALKHDLCISADFMRFSPKKDFELIDYKHSTVPECPC